MVIVVHWNHFIDILNTFQQLWHADVDMVLVLCTAELRMLASPLHYRHALLSTAQRLLCTKLCLLLRYAFTGQQHQTTASCLQRSPTIAVPGPPIGSPLCLWVVTRFANWNTVTISGALLEDGSAHSRTSTATLHSGKWYPLLWKPMLIVHASGLMVNKIAKKLKLGLL